MVSWELVVATLALAFVAIATVPSLENLTRVKNNLTWPGNNNLYVDNDGSATVESQRDFSSCKLQRAVLLLSSIAAAALSLTLAVLDTRTASSSELEHVVAEWLNFSAYAIFFTQAVAIALTHDPVKRYRFAFLGALEQAVLLSTVFLRHNIWNTSSHKRELLLANLLLFALGFLVCLTFPRRPDVFHEGKIVDRQWTVSALSHMTFSWVNSLLTFIVSHQKLAVDDLPTMDHNTRAKELHDSFNEEKRTAKLAKLVIMAHGPAILWQHLITMILAVLEFMPQISLYKLLRSLEAQSPGAAASVSSLSWAVGLGFFLLLNTLGETYMWYSSRAFVFVPMRIQLMALIFSKSMRRKDVKGAEKEDTATKIQSGDSDKNPESGPQDDQTEYVQKTRQGTINLVGFDAARISETAIYQNFFLLTILKMAMSLTFLALLIGWRPLLAGMAGQLVIFPITGYFVRKYTNAQDDLMKARDRKLAILNETLAGIRQIKLSAQEDRWQAKIMAVRNLELDAIWTGFRADVVLIFSWLTGPVILSSISISVYAIIYGTLSASVAFTTISLLGQLQATMSWIPELTTNVINAWISLERIERYLNAPEKTNNTVNGDCISFSNASVAWPSDKDVDDQTFILKNINISFPANELSVISGKTGSGKSLLLAAILGEVEILEGTVTVPTSPPLNDRYDGTATSSNWIIKPAVAFVSQQPWIENRTFRDNVLFGLPFDESRYQKVLSACALHQDLLLLSDGDMTEIGAHGINLSGGQRWRITLARALYSRAGTLIMDDIFSAVDAHVGLHLLENAIAGELGQNRTRIIVTHHASLCLPRTKYSVHLNKGTVDQAGLVEELRARGKLDEILKDEEDAVSDTEDGDTFPNLPIHEHRRASSSAKTEGRLNGSHGAERRRHSTISARSDKIDDGGLSVGPKAIPKKFVEDETTMRGRISWAVYRRYMSAGGGFWFWAIIVLAFAIFEAGLLGQYLWLAMWTDSYSPKAMITGLSRNAPSYNITTRPLKAVDLDPDLRYYLIVYIGISLLLCVEGAVRYYVVFKASTIASRVLFHDFTHAVLRAPIRWLDTVPIGRVLNRFTTDFRVIDSEMSTAVAMVINYALRVIGITIAGIMVSPYMAFFAAMLIGVNSRFALHFLEGARETKRLESVTKSPIFDLFGSALAGVSTIRAFSKTDVYIADMFAKIDNYGSSLWYMWVFNQWLVFRLGLLGAAFSTAMALLLVSMKSLGAPLAGFALTFTLQYSMAVMWVLRQYSTVELGMNATERVVEYSELEIESQDGADVPAAWPAEGRLEVEDLVIGYAPDLPPVLRELSFTIEPNERIGIVGRTGAGKSSFTLALFRFLEAREGKIVIDGIDISSIKLRLLRSRLAIIPQDPVLFSGTVRSNLDPFEEHSDERLQEALQRVHLISPQQGVPESDSRQNVNPFSSLDNHISESGQNLSQGQRQLLCLARAILSHPKILVLDEATSAVDKATDELIQASIRDEFRNSTLIVIAHRLSTIADFDRIIVMGEGRAVEFGSPRELLSGKGVGAFEELVHRSGEEELLRKIVFGDERD
ncbi:ATP-dependent bile acid permease [Mytilinidion resinicola]|uniref:ATP-dependent bile acid permease n=1 Tax=Mytilinidion resinicola TaxID=574789 RepID=A0A6A6Z0M6_9PEZI|nr:ATP-dependent bile acid permease [Mytilinidion resinicola]KAF2814641.1 ATP-dependent bile acid permease [Mytilinidion resinicola]